MSAKNLLMIGGVGAAAWWLYENWGKLAGSSAAAPAGPSIPVSVLAASAQAAFVAAGRAQNLTDAQIQSKLNSFIDSYNSCVAGCDPSRGSDQPGCTPGMWPHGTWNADSGNCIGGTVVAAPPPPIPVPPAAASTRDRLVKNIPANSGTADSWNFYWTQLSGVTQTADLFTPGNRDELISAETYLARRAAAGLPVILPGGVSGYRPAMTRSNRLNYRRAF